MSIKLNVGFAEKEYVKALGAKWNAMDSHWYIPDGVNADQFLRWIPRDIKLFIDLVPSTAFFTNMRSELKPDEWEQVKKSVFSRANYRCEVCSGKGKTHPVECHERWHFDIETKIQKLVDLIALCPACHEATHMGLAMTRGRKSEAMNHFMKVTGMTINQANQHWREAYEYWEILSELNWRLDGSLLMGYADLSDETKEKIVLNTSASKWEIIEDDRDMPFVFLTHDKNLSEVA